jgi:hypothetical protein
MLSIVQEFEVSKSPEELRTQELDYATLVQSQDNKHLVKSNQDVDSTLQFHNAVLLTTSTHPTCATHRRTLQWQFNQLLSKPSLSRDKNR